MIEVWKQIPGYEPFYEASSLGRIRRCFTQGMRRIERYKTPDDSSKYLRLSLSLNGKKTRFTVHYLICLTFHGEPPPEHEVNHINGVKTDNSASNLEWVTKSEQHLHRFKVLGHRSPRLGVKLDPITKAKCIKTLKHFGKEKDKFGVVAGSKTSAALVLYERGATIKYVIAQTNTAGLSALTVLSKVGHLVKRMPNKVIKLTHKNDIRKPE